MWKNTKFVLKKGKEIQCKYTGFVKLQFWVKFFYGEKPCETDDFPGKGKRVGKRENPEKGKNGGHYGGWLEKDAAVEKPDEAAAFQSWRMEKRKGVYWKECVRREMTMKMTVRCDRL